MLARPDPTPPWLLAEVQDVLQQIFGEPARSCLFTQAEQDALDRHFTPINAALAERLAPLQPGFAVSRSPEATVRSLVFRDQIGSDFWARIARQTTRRILAANTPRPTEVTG